MMRVIWTPLTLDILA